MGEQQSRVILIVDDTPANLDLLVGILKSVYKVKAATSGERALKIAQGGTPPDLVLLDVMMPGMDGFEVCRRLKSDPSTAHVPVVFLTGNEEAAERAKGLEAGACDYVARPVAAEDLMARIARALEP